MLAAWADDPLRQREREEAIEAIVRVGTVDAAVALQSLLDDPFEHIRDRALTGWVRIARRNRDGARAWFAEKALFARQASVRGAAAEAIGASSAAEVAAALRRAVASETDPEILVRLAEASLGLRGKPALEGVFPALLRHRDGAVARAAAEAVARYEPPGDADDALRQVLVRHRSAEARAGAVLALARRGTLAAADLERAIADAEAMPRTALALSFPAARGLLAEEAGMAVLVRLLADPSWRVRVAAVQAALRLWRRDVVPLLIDRLRVETARPRDDVHRALVTLTRAEVPAEASLWDSWWAARGATFDPGPRPPPDLGGRIRFRDAHASPPRAGTHTVAFLDLPIESERIAFVFDLSGSMGEADGAGNGRSKLDALRERVGHLLGSLSSSTSFDLWVWRYPSAYPPRPHLDRAFGELRPPLAANRRRAERWMAAQEASGWGAFYEPIERAITEDIDTVAFVSDGVPSRGRYARRDRLVAAVARANRFAGLRVDTVLVGTRATDRAALEDLAHSTGGRFRAVR